jgi:hypothetical protein
MTPFGKKKKKIITEKFIRFVDQDISNNSYNYFYTLSGITISKYFDWEQYLVICVSKTNKELIFFYQC